MYERYQPTKKSIYGIETKLIDTKTGKIYEINNIFDVVEFLNKKENGMVKEGDYCD